MCILIYGYDAVLLETRRLILEREGFKVFTATELDCAVVLIVDECIDLFILCGTVKAIARDEALAAAHSLRPSMRTLIQMEHEHPSMNERDTFVEHF